jgi:hypothetical protein
MDCGFHDWKNATGQRYTQLAVGQVQRVYDENAFES